MSEMTVEQVIERLQDIIKRFKENRFRGILVFSNTDEKEAWMQSILGTAEDRLMLVDAAIISMRHEPNQETRDWFFTQLSNRFRLLIPKQQMKSGLV